jgi:Short C-terminal domain
MKRNLIPAVLLLSVVTLLAGCLNLQLGGGTSNRSQPSTVGQQLIDLQDARNKGALTEAEYQAQKAKILERK